MTLPRLAVPFIALALMAAAPASQEAAGPAPESKRDRQCFLASRVSNFSSVDPRVLNLRVGAKDVYQLDMFGACNDLDFNHEIGIVSRGSSWICSGFDATIISKSSIGTQRCQVRNVRKLTDAEVEALPSRARP